MESNKNSSGMLNGLPQTPRENRKIGPIVGVLVIVLVIIIAGIYFFGKRLNTVNTIDDVPTTIEVPQQQALIENSDISTINTDLNEQLKDIDYSF
jgi:hypothetical protein